MFDNQDQEMKQPESATRDPGHRAGKFRLPKSPAVSAIMSPHPIRQLEHLVKMDNFLLEVIRCPVTGSKLDLADHSWLETVNQAIKNGTLYNRGGQKVEAEIDEGLINQDRSLLLPIRQGILVMVSDEAIELSQVGQSTDE